MRHSCLPVILATALCLALSACSSTQDVLEPSALVPTQDTSLTTSDDGMPAVMPEEPQARSVEAPEIGAISADTRVRFAPVVGAPAETALPLSAQLSARANQRGIPVLGPDDPGASHIVKGYFSAISESGRTSVIYVWDVLDPAGNRVHRFQGRQDTPDSSEQGWTSVGADTMEAIADRSVDELAAWLSASAG